MSTKRKLPDLHFNESAYIEGIYTAWPRIDPWLIPGLVASEKSRLAAAKANEVGIDLNGVAVVATDIVRFNGKQLLTKPQSQSHAFDLIRCQSGQEIVDIKGTALHFHGNTTVDYMAFVSENHNISRKEALDLSSDPHAQFIAGGLSVTSVGGDILKRRATQILWFDGEKWLEVDQITACKRDHTRVLMNELLGGGPYSGRVIDQRLEAMGLGK